MNIVRSYLHCALRITYNIMSTLINCYKSVYVIIDYPLYLLYCDITSFYFIVLCYLCSCSSMYTRKPSLMYTSVKVFFYRNSILYLKNGCVLNKLSYNDLHNIYIYIYIYKLEPVFPIRSGSKGEGFTGHIYIDPSFNNNLECV